MTQQIKEYRIKIIEYSNETRFMQDTFNAREQKMNKEIAQLTVNLAEVTSKVEAAEDAVRVAKENAILDMQKLT